MNANDRPLRLDQDPDVKFWTDKYRRAREKLNTAIEDWHHAQQHSAAFPGHQTRFDKPHLHPTAPSPELPLKPN